MHYRAITLLTLDQIMCFVHVSFSFLLPSLLFLFVICSVFLFFFLPFFLLCVFPAVYSSCISCVLLAFTLSVFPGCCFPFFSFLYCHGFFSCCFFFIPFFLHVRIFPSFFHFFKTDFILSFFFLVPFFVRFKTVALKWFKPICRHFSGRSLTLYHTIPTWATR